MAEQWKNAGRALQRRSTSLTGVPPRPTRTGTELQRYRDQCGLLVRQFMDDRLGNPETFLASLLTVMLHYPIEIVERIADPFYGLPSRQNRMPTPYDVRQMAEEFMAPLRREQARSVQIERQREEAALAARIDAERPLRPGIEAIEDECAARGVYLASYRKRRPWLFGTDGEPHQDTPERVRERFGLSREEWDALPNSGHPWPSC